MSVRVSAWVWEHSAAKGPELLVLLAIADSAEDDGTNAWPSVRYLARKVRMSERTVQRHLKTLAESHQILVSAPGGGRLSNSYAVLMRGDNLTPPGSKDGAPDDTPGVTELCHPSGDTADTPGVTRVSPKTSYRRPSTSKRRPAGKAGSGSAASSRRHRDGSDWGEAS